MTAHLVFSHGNSFTAGTYAMLFAHWRQQGHRVDAVDRFGHDPRYPVTSNWPHLVQQLADFVVGLRPSAHQPLLLVGHSLGGFLSLMCAAKHPTLAGLPVAGVIMLDSPVLGGWRAKALEAAKHVRLIGRLSPGRVSRTRRHTWASADEALTHFASKPLFAQWHPQVLEDYVAHGTDAVATTHGERCMLRFDRQIETRIYNTLPHNLDRLLRRHPLICPVAYIGGSHSLEMQQVGMTMTHKLVGHAPGPRFQLIDGSHLFPMEKPIESATAVLQAAVDLLGARPTIRPS